MATTGGGERAGEDEQESIPPDEAFSLLGNETRLQILRVLGDADEPLSFSDLYEGVDYDDTANFSYHLEKLAGHFVRKTDDGYTLRHAGARVVQAILSGAVTENPVVARTPVETACFLCGGQMEVEYREERVAVYCADCGGTRGHASETVRDSEDRGDDIVGGVGLPPAGVRGREPDDLLQVAEIWSVAKSQSLARDVCPHCAAPVERSVSVCEEHDPTDGRCPTCDQQFAVTVSLECTNCIAGGESVYTGQLLRDTDLMRFMIDHGIDPIAPEGFHLTDLEETVHSVDPFRAEFTFRADDEAITLTVDDDLSVVEATRTDAPAPD